MSFAKGDPATPASTTTGAEDLSEELRSTVTREPGDVVKCTRVGERFYRCNWWRSVFVDSLDNPGMKGGQLGTTYRVCRSAFLEVTRDGAGLAIKEVPPNARRRAVDF